jgi:hypothetical protein
MQRQNLEDDAEFFGKEESQTNIIGNVDEVMEGEDATPFNPGP